LRRTIWIAVRLQLDDLKVVLNEAQNELNVIAERVWKDSNGVGPKTCWSG